MKAANRPRTSKPQGYKPGLIKRMEKIAREQPELSHDELVQAAKSSFGPQTKEGKRRRNANLQKDRGRTSVRLKLPRDPGKKGVPSSPSSKARGKITYHAPDLSEVDVMMFATEWCNLDFSDRPAQPVVLKAIYGMELTPEEHEIYKTLTNGSTYVAGREVAEVILACGARGGKSSVICTIITLYESIVRAYHWRKYLRKDETGYAIIVATRLQQAQDIIQRNAAKMMLDNSLLRRFLAEEPTLQRITLTNGLEIMSIPCNSRAGRGIPIFLLLFDEVAHFFTEGKRADTTVYNSLSPRLAQFPGAKTGLISTPAAKQGMLWEWFKEGFDIPHRATFQAPTVVMNPMVDRDYLARQQLRDPENYAREFEGQFAERIGAYFSPEILTGASVLGGDVAPAAGHRYMGGIDQSGLAGKDRFGFSIAHKEGKKAVVDVARSWETTDADVILDEINSLAGAYNLEAILIDRYAKGWVASAIEKMGISVDMRPMLPIIYANAKTLLLSSKLLIPDNPELRQGLVNTVAYYGRNNALSIQHERTRDGHADLADATITAVYAATQEVFAEGYVGLPFDVMPA